MKKNYHVIALDMDGTVLNDKKKMGEQTRLAIHKALASGKEVVFCTGRSVAEMTEFLEEFPDMHYLCLESGALLYDHHNSKVLDTHTIDKNVVCAIRKIVDTKDVLPQIFSNGRTLMNQDKLNHLEHYHIEAYRDTYERVATPVKNVFETITAENSGAEKINLFHTSPEDREHTRQLLMEQNLPLTLVYSEYASLECTAPDISKVIGLQSLCKILNITMEDVIMVGDADNDRTALEGAGLAIAMKNANPQIKEICDVIVSDNNHDGCAEAIEKYLLA